MKLFIALGFQLVLIGATCSVATAVKPPSKVADDGTRTTRIRCSSRNDKVHMCRPPLYRDEVIDSVQVRRILGSRPCVEDDSWYFDGTNIFVLHGCRADFTLKYRPVSVFKRPKPYPDQAGRCTCSPEKIVIRAFEDIYDRKPSASELRSYRSLYIDYQLTEWQLRDGIRSDKNKRPAPKRKNSSGR